MPARRIFLRAITLGLPAALLLAGCKHWREGAEARSQQARDGGAGSGDGGSGGGGGGGGGGNGGY